MDITAGKIEQLEHFADVFSDGMLHVHIGASLTCGEAEALAGALEALGALEGAKSLLESHAEGDDCGDMHCTCDLPKCKECGECAEDGDHGMCASCLHDALRSGWVPGEEG